MYNSKFLLSHSQRNKNIFSCSDATITAIICDYLTGCISAVRATQDLIENMAYIPSNQIIENDIIFDLLISLLENATWKKQIDSLCGDYDPQHLDYWFRLFGTYCTLDALKTPKTALQIIHSCWSSCYSYSATYEAIECCVAAAENIIVPPFFDAQLKSIGLKLSMQRFTY